MTITRYLNGKEISLEELYKLNATNRTLDTICSSVINRVRKEHEKALSTSENFLYH